MYILVVLVDSHNDNKNIVPPSKTAILTTGEQRSLLSVKDVLKKKEKTGKSALRVKRREQSGPEQELSSHCRRGEGGAGRGGGGGEVRVYNSGIRFCP